MINTDLYLKIKKDKMSEEEKVRHERIENGIDQFAKELQVEPLSFALAFEAVSKKRREDNRIWPFDEFEVEVEKLAKALDKYIDQIDLEEIKMAILAGEDITDAVRFKRKEAK